MRKLVEKIEKKRLEMKRLIRKLTDKHGIIQVSINGFEEDEHLSVLLDEKVFLDMFSDFDVKKHKKEMYFPYELTHRDGGICYCALLDEHSYEKHVQGGKKDANV